MKKAQLVIDNVTLTSMLKRVDVAVQNLSKLAMEDKFPGGETTVYGLAEEGVGISGFSWSNS